jgi:hypothetical protein
MGKNGSMKRWTLLGCLLWAWTIVAWSEVSHFEITSMGSVLDGKEFGKAGPYEEIRGKVFFQFRPNSSEAEGIADVKLAPLDDDDKVAFSADFYLLWPVHAEQGNGTVLMEVVNRGNKLMLPFFQGAVRVPEPSKPEHFGDSFLMEQGYALLWVGWQHDVPDGDDRIRLYPPIARNPDGSPIQGLVRSEILVNTRTQHFSLADRDHKAYPVSNPEDGRNVMYVRDSREGARRQVPRSQWRFGRMENGSFTADPTHVTLEGGFEPFKIYEVVYVAENPPLAGLGMAALRDMALYLKYTEEALFGIQEKPFARVYAFGVSQSARLMRQFLYDRMNRGVWSQRAFDGMLVHVAGGGRGSFNVRFAQPSRDGHPFSNMFYPTDIFPFTDRVQTDRETGQEDGLLKNLWGELSRGRGVRMAPALRQGLRERLNSASRGPQAPVLSSVSASDDNDYDDLFGDDDDEDGDQVRDPNDTYIPRIFYTNSSYEYWGRAASLTHTRLDGRRDAELHDNTRSYLFSGTQHQPAPWPPVHTQGKHLANPNDFHPAMRALLVRLDQWVKGEQDPPPNQMPQVRGRSLVAPDRLRWPRMPDAPLLTGVQKAYRVDYGPRFWEEGIVDKEPPGIGREFPVQVPQVDADGNEIAGVRMPAVTVPLATYTGWNPFRPEYGPEAEISSMVGSFIPFPRTRDEARASGDRRRPISDRYQSREDYLRQVEAAARQLMRDGFLLERDLLGVVERAGQQWDWVMAQP